MFFVMRRVGEITEQTVAAELASGKAYLHTAKDVNGRPVIVIRAQKHVTGESQSQTAGCSCTHSRKTHRHASAAQTRTCLLKGDVLIST